MCFINYKQVGRIELPPLAWKARALPLCNTCK